MKIKKLLLTLGLMFGMMVLPGLVFATHDAEPPASWSVIPFAVLLIMIATGPLFYAHFWHKNYPKVAIGLGVLVVIYYLFFLHDTHKPLHSLAEYISFIALLTALFVASGGILIKIDKAGKPLANAALLIIGAAIANIIGTTGASMLLIRPFIRLNKGRIKPYHIVFFIFIVSNVGGCLTPIGDPPLFLGFLKGIDFFWTVTNIWPVWCFGVGLLALIFYFVDSRNKEEGDTTVERTGKISVEGSGSLLWLGITIGAVFIDPSVLDWVPGLLQLEDGSFTLGTTAGYTPEALSKITVFSFIREIIMFATAFMAFKFANKDALKGNEFDFEPIKEVAFLFIGIFATMMPALQLIEEFAKSADGQAMVNVHTLYWTTGALSGVLDNAPTYLNFLAAGLGKVSLSMDTKEHVLAFMNASSVETLEYAGMQINAFKYLLAISVAAVFFGAMTYIGNAPNFMVKSIAEQVGIEMPSFMGYVIRYSIPILVPVLFLTWLVFFSWA